MLWHLERAHIGIGFWARLRYAIEFHPIERPLRWIFNLRLRINSDLA